MNSRKVYFEKTDPWSSHSLIYKWLECYDEGTRILDIGTATGILGKKCVGLGFHLKGIEPVYEWAQAAKTYYDEILCSTLEQTPDEFLAKQDIVICADVLEHMRNPEELLCHLVDIQEPTTKIIISVPNIANIWIRLNLLVGRFEYVDYGILDKTHLRFFTKSSFLRLIESCSLRPIETVFTPIPLSKVHPFFASNPVGCFIQRLAAIIAKLLPGLFAYQFITLAEIKRP